MGILWNGLDILRQDSLLITLPARQFHRFIFVIICKALILMNAMVKCLICDVGKAVQGCGFTYGGELLVGV